MTKAELEQYKNLPGEISDIKRDLDNIPIVVDAVKGSRISIPHDLHTIQIEGVDTKQEFRLRMRLKFREEELQEIERKIEAIPDSEIRRIIDLKYRKKKKWFQVAHEFGGNVTGDSLRMKLERFLKKS